MTRCECQDNRPAWWVEEGRSISGLLADRLEAMVAVDERHLRADPRTARVGYWTTWGRSGRSLTAGRPTWDNSQMDWTDAIGIDAGVLGGKPVIRGTRLAVEFVVGLLAQGWTFEQILDNYPGITREQILACLAYAADSLRGGGPASSARA
jgi:uncharacterized protein (DUF433 family)